MTALRTSCTNLRSGWRALRQHWQDTRELWNDAEARNFGTNHITPLERHATETVRELEQLAAVIEQARRRVP